MKSPIYLGVNIDHVATLRQARKTSYPNPVHAAFLAEKAGADSITVHLREDRRHIQDNDVRLLRETIETKLNLEMAATAEMLKFALEVTPDFCCLVPEKREELTTEGGLDIVHQQAHILRTTERLEQAGIAVSLFIDPEPQQIEAASQCGASMIELHTGTWAEAEGASERRAELARITAAAEYGRSLGLQVNAGHGLTFQNVAEIAAIPEIVELNIGHSLIAQSVFMGLEAAVARMKSLMNEARSAA